MNSLIFKLVNELVSGRKDIKVLEIGFGRAKDIKSLAMRHRDDLFYGIDITFRGVKHENNLILAHGNICSFFGALPDEFPEEFDIIYSANVMHLLDNRCKKKMLKRVRTHLKQGGLFILVDLLNKVYKDNGRAEFYYGKNGVDGLKKLISKYFNIIKIEQFKQDDGDHIHDGVYLICKHKLL